MKRMIMSLVAGAVALGGVAAGPQAAQQAPDHEAALAIGETATVTGTGQFGVNVQNYVGDDYECSSDPYMYCESVLVALTNPYEEENARKGRERANFVFELVPLNPGSDYDVLVFESDADGNRGGEIASAGAIPIADHPESIETVTVPVTTTADEETVYVLVNVVYWAAVGGWDANLSFE